MSKLSRLRLPLFAFTCFGAIALSPTHAQALMGLRISPGMAVLLWPASIGAKVGHVPGTATRAAAYTVTLPVRAVHPKSADFVTDAAYKGPVYLSAVVAAVPFVPLAILVGLVSE